MACEDIETKLTLNKNQREELAQLITSQRVQAQFAYQSYQSLKVRPGEKYDANWTGFYNGKTFNDPYALEAYAKEKFDSEDAKLKDLITKFNDLFPIKDQLEQDLQQCQANQASTKKDNAGDGTPGSAGTVANTTPSTAVTGTTTPETTTDPSRSPDDAANALAESLQPGQKAPETISKTTDPGAKTGADTGTDTLGEVQIQSTKRGLQAAKDDAVSQAAQSDSLNWANKGDWRVRLSLAPGADYLYKSKEPGILAPLAATDGIVFPYTPSINVNYSANYDNTAVQHSNYRIFQYQNSAVENISITCDFTAQSTKEANYILAVIHFLRSVTKMFYGKDSNPIAGTPPPLCYLTGLGQYQFNAHPLLITQFTYALPTDVDYIRAVLPASFTDGNSIGDTPKNVGTNLQEQRRQTSPTPAGIGGNPNPAALTPNGSPGSSQPTYVPTKIQIQIAANPVVSRSVISNDFSLKQYATGALLLGKNNSSKGGIW